MKKRAEQKRRERQEEAIADITAQSNVASRNTPAMPSLKGIADVAAAIGVAPITVRKMLMRKALTYVKIGGRTLIPVSEVVRLVERNTVERTA